jgi:molybdopterin-guanine dinucleotide biosynthesis protein A
MTQVLGVILAGGQSRRMGSPKHDLAFGNKTLLDYAYERLARQCDAVIINVQQNLLGYTVVQDIFDGSLGPLAGLHGAMVWAKDQGYSHIATIAVDTPFFPTDYVARLKKNCDVPIVLAGSKGRSHPTCGLWCVNLGDDLAKALQSGDRRVMAWVQTHEHRVETFETGSVDPFFNVNTPEDYDTAKAILAGQI